MQIKSGFFYKTRDGRKALVGDNVGDTIFPFYHEVDGRGWHGVTAEGKSCLDRDNDDLIAEWIDEPAAATDFTPTDDGWSRPPVATPKFKVGDRVKFCDDYGSSAAGKEATVLAVNVWGDGVYIQVDQGGRGGISTENAEDLRLVATTSTTTPSIVAAIENGQPLPARKPFVHGDRDSALREAARLAKMHTGKEFGVYELVGTAKEAKVYDFEWQRLAAEGQKIEAIKELRRMAGVSLLSAKNAVEHIELTRAA